MKDFIHKCYIESARAIYNNPELFWHELPKLNIKRNQLEIIKIIDKSIQEAIRKMLPVELILKEYLDGEYPEEDIYEHMYNRITPSQYENIKKLLERTKKSHHKNKESSSVTEEDYMKDTHSYNYSHHGSGVTSKDDSSSDESEKETNSSSNSDYYTSKSRSDDKPEDNNENIKLFLKDIETQLHGLDDKMKAVKAVKEIPNKNDENDKNDKNSSSSRKVDSKSVSKSDSEQNKESHSDKYKGKDNIFEKVDKSPIHNATKVSPNKLNDKNFNKKVNQNQNQNQILKK